MAENIRQMTACGKLYPSDAKQLADMMQLQPTDKGDVNAIVVPYGSYKTALDAYKASYETVAGKHFDSVIVISPAHRISFQSIALSSYDKWACPFGELETDKQAADYLSKCRSEYIYADNRRFEKETAAELQLPFIYKCFGQNVKIVPIIIGETNTKFTIMLANALYNLLAEGAKADKKYLIIVTTNLSTKRPFEEAIVKDTAFAKILSELKPDWFSEQLALGTIVAHGGGGVTTLLRVAEKAEWKNLRILKTYNTGDITDNKLEVDGYIAACL